MATRRRKKRRIRWGRIATLLLVIVLTVATIVVRPYQRVRRYLAQRNMVEVVVPHDSVLRHAMLVDSLLCRPRANFAEFDSEGRPVHHRVLSVSSFADAFPDLNDVQLATARKLGLTHPIEDREEAERLKSALVYIGDSPYYDLRLPMNYSIPYLVPRAERLLTEIARSFQDSLVSKGLPMHKIQVSSVLRTESDVSRLRRGNANATDQSCHRYGTTFDLSYNYYTRVQAPSGLQLPEHWGVQLKSVLAEVLRDQRDMGTCYVKYEYKKPCFHITCR